MVPAGAQVICLSDMYGTINSPNFPEPYPKESEVRWNISVPDGFQIRLYFLHFDLEPSYLCEYDYVKVSESWLRMCVASHSHGENASKRDTIHMSHLDLVQSIQLGM